ncbi:hypothetical protein NS365_04565 [Aureimonas ureilytica]|uniref:Phage tail protein n=1 Tax=Aureimonas ureilytica TaxID=401562 RepID=A0A175RU78_9HYPH|nr:phage tail tube protein [Aureimonas ureilytica]KTR07335.1 hypothetical protein NS365_04565 [Aureimonas ureilytica]
MAQPQTMRFGKFRVLLGNGATPEVFTAPCGFTSRSFSRSKELTDVTVPDCDDPDAPSHVARDVRSLSSSISGSGILAKSALPVWEKAFESTESVNCRVEMDWGATKITYEQRFHISSMELTADDGARVQLSIQMESDGAFKRTEA